MPKLKTNRAAAKRLKVTKNGKVKYKKAFKRHLQESRSPKSRRQARQAGYVSKANIRQIKQMLPYA